MSPPYPPKGLLSIDGDGLVWSPTPRGWKNFTRWLDVRNPHPIRILWTEVLELRLEPGVRDRRNLRVCLPDGPYAAERNSWFGSVSRTELIAVCENLGCTVKADPTHPGEEIISLPGRASGAD
jgi:hypothetical protein